MSPVAPGTTLTLGTTGATGAVTFDFSDNQSGGTITPEGIYTAGPTGGVTDTIVAYDGTSSADASSRSARRS